MNNRKTYKVKRSNNIEMFPSDPYGSLDDSFNEKTLVFIDAGFLSKLSKHFGNGNYLKFKIRNFVKNICIKESVFPEKNRLSLSCGGKKLEYVFPGKNI